MGGHCNASHDAQDVWDTESTSLASGCNAGGSDTVSVFAALLCVQLSVLFSADVMQVLNGEMDGR